MAMFLFRNSTKASRKVGDSLGILVSSLNLHFFGMKNRIIAIPDAMTGRHQVQPHGRRGFISLRSVDKRFEKVRLVKALALAESI